jgi:CheY-like chemotaxis protein
VVKQATEEARAAAQEKGVALSAVEPEPGALVRGDPSRLVQVMGNLLSNAIKFTPAGKAIGVRLTPGPEHIEVVVQDEGIGVTSDFLPRLFRPFNQFDATTTRQHGGLGLGLSIVRTLLELQGGQAFAHSAGPGLGATFTIRLPRVSDVPQADVKEPFQPLLPVPLTGVRLLVVDDQPDVRAMLAEMLLSCGATVTTVASVHEAVQALRLGSPDVVISDIAMPVEDGYALVARIRAQAGPVGSMPVIALTAYASLADQEHAIAAGFDRYLAKPVDVARLSHAVAELLRDRLLEPRQ